MGNTSCRGEDCKAPGGRIVKGKSECVSMADGSELPGGARGDACEWCGDETTGRCRKKIIQNESDNSDLPQNEADLFSVRQGGGNPNKYKRRKSKNKTKRKKTRRKKTRGKKTRRNKTKRNKTKKYSRRS